MARHALHDRALDMRKTGMSYSQIKEELKVSKSTLSLWLREMPLSKDQIRSLRDKNAIRIERYRETRKRTRDLRQNRIRDEIRQKLGNLSAREIFIGGLFLYWGEGTKRAEAATILSNTDPVMLQFFMKWVDLLEVGKSNIRVRLHLYSDMNVKKEMFYWSKTLGISVDQFRKPYIKISKSSEITYPRLFSHGTCSVLVYGRDLHERTMLGLEYLRSSFADTANA
jgi:hypothetical protein